MRGQRLAGLLGTISLPLLPVDAIGRWVIMACSWSWKLTITGVSCGAQFTFKLLSRNEVHFGSESRHAKCWD